MGAANGSVSVHRFGRKPQYRRLPLLGPPYGPFKARTPARPVGALRRGDRPDLPVASSLSGSGSGSDGVELPIARHAPERVHATVGELDSGAGDEVGDGARDEHLARPRSGAHARADVHRDAAHISVAHQLALAGVQTGADLDAERANRVAGRARAANPSRGTVERRQEPVAHRLDLSPTMAVELATHELIVA